MGKAPFYSPSLSRYRDKAHSAKQNEFTQDIFHDVTELFNAVNEQSKEIAEIEKVFEVTSHYTEASIREMKRQMTLLEEELYATQNLGKIYTKTLYPCDAEPIRFTKENETAFIDLQHDIISVKPLSSGESKLYLYDEINKNYIIPSTTTYEVFPKADGVTITENDFKHALLPNEHKVWHREYQYFSVTKTEVKADVTINLPDNIITNKDVNTIYLHPFPLNSIDIDLIEYKMNGVWLPIPGFVPVKEAGNIKLCFSPTEMDAIRIKMKQRHFIEKGGKQIFHLGLVDVGVSYNEYPIPTSKFDIPFEFNQKFTNKYIVGITPVYQNEGALREENDVRLSSFQIYEVDRSGRETYVNDSFPIRITTDRVIVRGQLSYDKGNKITPTLASVKISYKADS